MDALAADGGGVAGKRTAGGATGKDVAATG
jgi:hypothetical protein